MSEKMVHQARSISSSLATCQERAIDVVDLRAGLVWCVGVLAMPGVLTAQSTRDPWLQPFASSSIWNTSIGSEAKYIPADLEATKRVDVDDEWLIRVPSGASNRTLFAPKSWSQRAGGKTRLTSIPIPDDLLVPDARKGYTPNNCAALLMPDGRTIKHIAPLCRPRAGGPIFGHYFQPDGDLYGDGINGSHGGSALSAIGGSIRKGELTNEHPIRHAIKINLWCKHFCYYGPDRKGFRWPATTADSYAKRGYGGKNRAVVMGSLLAVPPSITWQQLGVRTQIGRKLFHAFQDYGAYVVDDTAWDMTHICAEKGVAEEVERIYGYSLRTKSGPYFEDVGRLVEALHVVDNNSPETIGGGGTPRIAPTNVNRRAR